MNHIAETWITKISNKTNSPTSRRILSENIDAPNAVQWNSWRSKMLTKVKACRDAIKNMMVFDRLPNSNKVTQTASRDSNNASIVVGTRTSMSSIPDIISFSSIAMKHNDYGEERILMRNYTRNSDDTEELNTSTERREDAKNVNDSLNFVPADDTASSSLKSFLRLEKQIQDEFIEDDNVFTIKKKISAEPFLSYSEGTAEFVWLDDTTEDSFSGKVWNSLERLNSSEIGFGMPRTNSTFCENPRIAKQNLTSSPIRSFAIQDSGFENNFSV